MRFTELFTKTLRESPADETAVNAQLLIRGGFAYKNSAGIYSYLPLGWRVIKNIERIVREEMDAIGGQEMLMPALIDEHYYDLTGRANVDIVFRVKGTEYKTGDFILGWSHEEVLTEIVSKYISSYKDLPFSAYQIQTKSRNEPRAKSGLLRGREFLMKDLYSFHTSEQDLLRYYDVVRDAYLKAFKRCGLDAVYTLAGGGVFTISNTHEFQVIADVGEDTIFVCDSCRYAENKEIAKLKDGDAYPTRLPDGQECDGKIREKQAIEVGNIFPLGTKYSDAFGLMFTDEKGKKQPIVMGSYGIGISRLMATVVEIFHDDKGIVWPESVAPFKMHLIALDAKAEADEVYQELLKKGVEVLYDDREDKTAGEKFADADLIGCPLRLVVSAKTVEQNSVEIKRRTERDSALVPRSEYLSRI